jgi:hypothetical protein
VIFGGLRRDRCQYPQKSMLGLPARLRATICPVCERLSDLKNIPTLHGPYGMVKSVPFYGAGSRSSSA